MVLVRGESGRDGRRHETHAKVLRLRQRVRVRMRVRVRVGPRARRVESKRRVRLLLVDCGRGDGLDMRRKDEGRRERRRRRRTDGDDGRRGIRRIQMRPVAAGRDVIGHRGRLSVRVVGSVVMRLRRIARLLHRMERSAVVLILRTVVRCRVRVGRHGRTGRVETFRTREVEA